MRRYGWLLVLSLSACGGAPATPSHPQTHVDYDVAPLAEITCTDWRYIMSRRQRETAAQRLLLEVASEDAHESVGLSPRSLTALFADTIARLCAREGGDPLGHASLAWQVLQREAEQRLLPSPTSTSTSTSGGPHRHEG
jgi:hypothetical protein